MCEVMDGPSEVKGGQISQQQTEEMLKVSERMNGKSCTHGG